MKEKEFIRTIKSILKSSYIGDDCAYLTDENIVVTQDSLVEDVHFKRDFITPFELGFKSTAVNISDICASGAKPKYLTVSLSLPPDITKSFVEDFYKGAKSAANGAAIVGGDLTGSDKIFVSITAIGSAEGRKISSRSNAKIGYKVIVSGNHGSSAAGLKSIEKGLKNNKFAKIHLMPEPQINFSKQIAENITCDYAMTDTSDGLADALMQIAIESNKVIEVDFEKIPCDKEIKNYGNPYDLVLFGGEDYQLAAAVPENLLAKIENYTVIGEILPVEYEAGLKINYNGQSYFYNLESINKKIYNHFEE